MPTDFSFSLPTGSHAARALQLAKEPTPAMRKALGASAAALVALGLLALPFASSNDAVPGLTPPSARPAVPAATSAPAAVELPAAEVPSGSGGATTAAAATAAPDSAGGWSAAAGPARQAFVAPHGTVASSPAPPASSSSPTQAAAAPAPAPTGQGATSTPTPLSDLLRPLLPTGPATAPVVPALPAPVSTSAAGTNTGNASPVATSPAPTSTTTTTTPGPVVQVGPVTVHLP